jgi:8-oxo-dGTP diphosphatase
MTTLRVAAAVAERHGLILVTRRQPGVHLEGHWEFPGGKCEPGESLPECLARELREELDVEATVTDEIFTTVHEYTDRRVELHFFRCELHGEVAPQLGQEAQWLALSQLGTLEFAPADRELVARLNRPHPARSDSEG